MGINVEGPGFVGPGREPIVGPGTETPGFVGPGTETPGFVKDIENMSKFDPESFARQLSQIESHVKNLPQAILTVLHTQAKQIGPMMYGRSGNEDITIGDLHGKLSQVVNILNTVDVPKDLKEILQHLHLPVINKFADLSQKEETPQLHIAVKNLLIALHLA